MKASSATTQSGWRKLLSQSSPKNNERRDDDAPKIPLQAATSTTSRAFQPLPTPRALPSSPPITANFSSTHIVTGAGVAIFHLASARIVVCRHSVHGYYFLPKGRRDVGEETGAGAEREGFEESGYRNRLLPIPLRTLQPQAHNPSEEVDTRFVTEPVYTQLAPLSNRSQYLLFWFIAETVPPEVEEILQREMEEMATGKNPTPYQYPPRFPRDMTLKERVKMERERYEPVRHENTGVDEEEALYESYLLPIDDALRRLKGSVQEEVVRIGWNGICERYRLESQLQKDDVRTVVRSAKSGLEANPTID